LLQQKESKVVISVLNLMESIQAITGKNNGYVNDSKALQPESINSNETEERIEEEVLRALEILCEPGSAYEVRILGIGGKKRTNAGYFRDRKKMAKAIVKYDKRQSDYDKPSGIYITINPVKDNLYYRSPDEMKECAQDLTKDTETEKRRWLPIDLDVTDKVSG